MVMSQSPDQRPLNDQEHVLISTGDELPTDIGEAIEAYCVRCRHTVTMAEPEPVWTSKGTPGTRGVCPECGTTVFRMGKTAAHDAQRKPSAVRVDSDVKVTLAGRRRRPLPATYINYHPSDAEFAEQLASDLEKAGVHTWIEVGEAVEQDVNWAGGVHPALKDSSRMVFILSDHSLHAEKVITAWDFFKKHKKQIAIAIVGTATVPDALRRSPRYDFRTDYKLAFRQLLSILSD